MPSHPQGPESAPTAGVIVLIIMCAKPEKRLLSRFGKTKQNKNSVSVLQLVFHHASPFARRCFEGSIVFTGVVGILISLSLEIPCACCGLCWTVPTPTAPRHFFFPLLFLTHWSYSKKQSHAWKLLHIHTASSAFQHASALSFFLASSPFFPSSLLPSLVSKSRSFCLLDASCG